MNNYDNVPVRTMRGRMGPGAVLGLVGICLLVLLLLVGLLRA